MKPEQRWWRAGGILIAVVALGPTLSSSAQERGSERDVPVFGVESSVVLLDVVVRDKKGRPIRDLKASDFEVSEDGARQELVAFRVYGGAPEPAETGAANSAAGGAPAATAPPAPTAGVAETRPSIIAFVFDRMSSSARATVRKAAMSYLEKGHVDGDVVGVFSIDLALNTLVPFTRDMRKVRPVFQQLGSLADTQFASTREEARSRRAAVDRGEEQLNALGAGGATGSGEAQAAAQVIGLQVLFEGMQARMLRAFDSLERDQQGFASTNGLAAVVSSLKSIPGRKTVLFFSEGIAIPSNVYGQFRALIANANQANVSVYAVDAGGLRVDSGTHETQRELAELTNQRMRQESTGLDSAPGGSMLRQLERNEDLMRLNPESGLGQLAEETGGFLIRDTNDPSKSFGRIQEDMRFHYLVSYAPTNANYDGRFRTVAVKVARPGAEIQTRKGYFAVRPGTVVPVRNNEGPALALLDRDPPPSDFPLYVAALSFPESKRPGRVPVLVEIPGAAITYVRDKTKPTHDADFSVVVRLRNAEGLEVDRLSQQYPLTVPSTKLEAVRQGPILFFKETDLAPGRYTLDAVAYDAMGKKASVRHGTVTVPPLPDGQVRLSSVMVLKRIERLSAAEKGGDNPLYYGETILYPNLGEPLRKATMPNLGFYFSAYGTVPGAQATVELRQGGQIVAQAAQALAAPDATGRVQHAAALPLGDLPPGRYTLRVSLANGTSSEAGETSFTVEE